MDYSTYMPAYHHYAQGQALNEGEGDATIWFLSAAGLRTTDTARTGMASL